MENSIGSFIIRPSLGDSFISGMNILYEEQDMEMKLIRNTEKIMSICLTWFPIGGYRRTQYITSISLFYNEVGVLLGG
jgi:hypothetical protein